MGGKTVPASATIAALEALGDAPLIAPPVATAPRGGPAVVVGLDLARYHKAALNVLADEIGHRLGQPALAISAVIATLPADWLPLLDDWAGWWHIAEAVAERLGLSDPDNPVLPDWMH
jgi:hypothetical protein